MLGSVAGHALGCGLCGQSCAFAFASGAGFGAGAGSGFDSTAGAGFDAGADGAGFGADEWHARTTTASGLHLIHAVSQGSARR